ncbi:hypothetical protein [Amycolatopsis sp. BJA-103]|uniref:hypothetical protein n=1 Tax=Amycolatopsis sp. BJA-103 TaxID=1911175 RepID=UPI001304DBAC|nr:hypothetical protein [Amycolatopsis sp. BJA-103]
MDDFRVGDIVFSPGVGLEGQILAVREDECPFWVWWSDDDVSWERGSSLELVKHFDKI